MGAALGIAIGVTGARIGPVWRAIRWGDWRQFPSTLIATLVPAVAGVYYAQRVVATSIKSQRRAELEAEQDFVVQAETRAATAREARRKAWERLFQCCTEFTGFASSSLTINVDARARREWKDSYGRTTETSRSNRQEEAAAARADFEFIKKQGEIAKRIVEGQHDFGLNLARNLNPIRELLDELVTTHGVELLTVPLEAVELLGRLPAIPRLWIDTDVEGVFALATARVEGSDTFDTSAHDAPTAMMVDKQTASAISYLRSVSDRYRTAPHEPGDVEMWTTRPGYSAGGSHSQDVDVLAAFAHLVDRLQKLLADIDGSGPR